MLRIVFRRCRKTMSALSQFPLSLFHSLAPDAIKVDQQSIFQRIYSFVRGATHSQLSARLCLHVFLGFRTFPPSSESKHKRKRNKNGTNRSLGGCASFCPSPLAPFFNFTNAALPLPCSRAPVPLSFAALSPFLLCNCLDSCFCRGFSCLRETSCVFGRDGAR